MRISHPTNLANFSRLEYGDAVVFFSYETPIAVITDNFCYVTENEWAYTTAKHINYVKDNYMHVQIVPHERIRRTINQRFKE